MTLVFFLASWNGTEHPKSCHYRDFVLFIYSTTTRPCSQWVSYTVGCKQMLRMSLLCLYHLAFSLYFPSINQFLPMLASLLSFSDRSLSFWKVLFQQQLYTGFLLSFQPFWSKCQFISNLSIINCIPPYGNFIFSLTAPIIIKFGIIWKQIFATLFSLISSSWKQTSNDMCLLPHNVLEVHLEQFNQEVGYDKLWFSWMNGYMNFDYTATSLDFKETPLWWLITKFYLLHYNISISILGADGAFTIRCYCLSGLVSTLLTLFL